MPALFSKEQPNRGGSIFPDIKNAAGPPFFPTGDPTAYYCFMGLLIHYRPVRRQAGHDFASLKGELFLHPFHQLDADSRRVGNHQKSVPALRHNVHDIRSAERGLPGPFEHKAGVGRRAVRVRVLLDGEIGGGRVKLDAGSRRNRA